MHKPRISTNILFSYSSHRRRRTYRFSSRSGYTRRNICRSAAARRGDSSERAGRVPWPYHEHSHDGSCYLAQLPHHGRQDNHRKVTYLIQYNISDPIVLFCSDIILNLKWRQIFKNKLAEVRLSSFEWLMLHNQLNMCVWVSLCTLFEYLWKRRGLRQME